MRTTLRATAVLPPAMVLCLMLLPSLMSCASYQYRKPRLDLPPMPLDLRYRAQGQSVSLDVDDDRTVSLDVGREERVYAKVSRESVDELSALLASDEFRSYLREIRGASKKTVWKSSQTMSMYSRGFGTACFYDEDGGWSHQTIKGSPPFVASLEDPSSVPDVLMQLVELVNELGAEAFGESFLPIEPGAPGTSAWGEF